MADTLITHGGRANPQPGDQIYAAMVKAMRDIDAIAKSEENKQQGFSFRGIDSVINAVGPVLRDHGIFMLPTAGAPIVDHYSSRGGAQMTHVLLPVKVRFVADDGSEVSCTVWGEAADAGDKVVSKAHSVALRIALLEVFAIPTGDPDPDDESHERADPVAAAEADLAARGFDSLEEFEEVWVRLRDATKGEGEALDWIRSWVRKSQIRKGSLTATQADLWQEYLDCINADGDWKPGHEPDNEGVGDGPYN